ncbi:MAG: DNA polymerase I [Litorimonas sp.]
MSETAPVTPKSHVVLVDGSGYIFRAFHALPPLTRKSDGLPIGAVAGFCNMLFKMLKDQKDENRPTHFAVIFDKGSVTFRNDLYDAYKANRGEPPEDLVPQFPLTRDATRAFGAPAVEMEGFEADDLIATYARQAEGLGARVTIISSDKDLMQLVSERVSMLDPMKNKPIGVREVEEKFGVSPDKVIDVQALAGDSVDNIPGVPGIGIKTAALLLGEYGDLETLLERAAEIKQKGRREKLIEHAESARVSKALVTLKTDVAVEVPLQELGVTDPDVDVLFDFLEEMGFRTLTARVREALGAGESDGLRSDDTKAMTVSPALRDRYPNTEFVPSRYECVQSEARLAHWIDRAVEEGVVAVDLETDSLDSRAANLVGVCLAVDDNEACYVPLGHKGEGDLLGEDAPEQIDTERALAMLRPMLEDEAVLKVGQNFKYDLGVFLRHDIRPAPYDDTMLISYAMENGLHGHGMDTLSETHFGHSPVPFKEIAGTGKNRKTFDQIGLEDATRYAAEDADVTLRLWRFLKPKLAPAQVTRVYEAIDRDMPAVVAKMENEGIKVDRAELSRLSSMFEQKLAMYESEAHEIAGEPFNVGSPKQVGEVLFDKMGLPGGKKTKAGAWQTGVDILEDLAAGGEPLPRAVLNWRQFSKLKSTYTDALQKQINPETDRVHTSFQLAATLTGRLSSSDPNLQNIPIRTEEGRKIRDAFIAEPGHLLVAADYSQIELRLLAHMADLPNMKQAFADGIDIHAMAASEMFGVKLDEMTPEIRRRAKAINFGIIYGISAFGLANNTGVDRQTAGEYIKTYFEKFPGIRDFMNDTKAEAKERGYVTTLFGRKCHITGIRERNPARRQFAERQAINAPIQGTAADIMRRAMIRMPDAIHKVEGARMLLQVHDELVFEVPDGREEALIEIVRDVMEHAHEPAVRLSVPIDVEAQAARNWNDAH